MLNGMCLPWKLFATRDAVVLGIIKINVCFGVRVCCNLAHAVLRTSQPVEVVEGFIVQPVSMTPEPCVLVKY